MNPAERQEWPLAAAGLKCPLCGGGLLPMGGALRCAKGHSFDRSREGYVNLLPVQKKHAKDPGDSKEMVAARHVFLQAGYYAPFFAELGRLCALHAPRNANIVDAGCGEGSYDAALLAALSAAAPRPAGRCERELPPAAALPQGAAPAAPQLIGFDLSRPAVRLAARQNPGALFCVAGSFAAPVRDAWADVVLNIFSPMARQEFWRMLKPGGVLLYAVPTARHLFGLKQVLYPTPYENAEQTVQYEGFSLLERTEIKTQITVPGGQLQNLFAMTPYYWKTPRAGTQALLQMQSLSTEIGFAFLVYQKTEPPKVIAAKKTEN